MGLLITVEDLDWVFNLNMRPLVFYSHSVQHLDVIRFIQVPFNGFKVDEQRWEQHSGEEDLGARL